MLCVYTVTVNSINSGHQSRCAQVLFYSAFRHPALTGLVFSEVTQCVHVCVGMGVIEKMQSTRQTLVTLCCSALEGTQVLGCENIVVHSVDWGPMRFSAAAAGLIAEALFQVCLSFLLFALGTSVCM